MNFETRDHVITIGNAHYHHNITQGSDEWHKLRRGMLTASAIDKLITPATLKIANNKDTRTHVFELAAQRATDAPTDNYVSYAMERGGLEEIEARAKYSAKISPVDECGFITNDSLGFNVGFSPDGLVGDVGIIEIKSRGMKLQMQTIIEHLATRDDTKLIPREFMLQVQTGLWVTGREWCDFISYSNGMNMAVIRVEPIQIYQEKITEAVTVAEQQIKECVDKYHAATSNPHNLIIPVEWIDHHAEISA